jgi:hypothetical protein
MAQLGFKAVHHGAENIPDKVFENIPYVGPRYFREKDKQRKKDQRDRDDSASDSSDSASPRDRHSRTSRRSDRRSGRRSDMRDERDRGYDSDRGPRGYSDAPFFPPPPRIAVDEPEQHNVPPGDATQQTPFVPRPYNPKEYGSRPGTRDDYYAGHPQEQQPWVPPPGAPGQQQSQQAVSCISTLAL